MPQIPSCVVLVARLFPGRNADLVRLAESSAPFRSLCEDYELATETLQRLELQTQPEDVERMAEYRLLVAELQCELSRTLDAESK